MKLINFFVLLIASVFYVNAAFSQTVDDNSDIVGWSDVTIATPLIEKEENGKKVDKLALSFTSGIRMGRNLKRPIDQRAGVALTYRLNKYFSVGSGYLYHRFRPTEAPRGYEHRVLFFLLAKKDFKNVSIGNRALTTYLIKHSRPDSVVYRNRIQANFPIKKDNKPLITPFIAEEPFYDFRQKRFVRNDIYAGVTRQLSKNLAADFFYVHQNFRSGSLRQTNGFGVSFRYKVDKFLKFN